MPKQKRVKKGSPVHVHKISDSSIGNSYDLVRNHSDDSLEQKKRGSGNTLGSEKSRKSVHFRDGRSARSGDEDRGTNPSISADSLAKGLVDVAYFETLMRDKEPWVDHNYLEGFRALFSAGEVWVKEVQCIPCGLNTTYQISAKDEATPIFYVKKSQRVFSSWFKFFLCSSFSCCRNGFKIKLFNLTGTRLVTFVRKTHMCASQLDIVETFYGKEEMYVGRIERSAHGYILKDKHHDDIYRVMRIPKSRNSFKSMSRISLELSEVSGVTPENIKVGCCSSRKEEMKIFRTDTKEVIGRVVYMKRGSGLRFFSGCNSQPKIGFFCNPDVGTNAKVLLMGVLFFYMHSGHEKYISLPLGPDAVGFDITTLSHETSLDLLMKS